MALSDRITALTLAIANAVNARVGRVGASAYDIAVLNGYAGTQTQWFTDNAADSRAARVPKPITVENFWNATPGAAWPAQWTIRGTNTGTLASIIAAGSGRLLPGASNLSGVRASLEGVAARGETGIVASCTLETATGVFGAVFINGAGTGTGLFGYYIAPDNAYALEISLADQNVSLYQSSGAGTGTTLIQAAMTLAQNAEYRMRLDRTGRTLRGKVWPVAQPEPEGWTVTYAIPPATTPYTGYSGVGGQNGGGQPNSTVRFRDIYTYTPQTQATATSPGILPLATTAEVTAGTEPSKAITSAALRAASIMPPVLSTADPTASSDSSAGYLPGQEWINTANQSSYACISNAVGAAVWRRQNTDVQAFTASGTWTKPAWAMQVEVVCIGSGGGGGSGRRGPSGTAQGGGGGGSGGGFGSALLQASLLPATVAVTTGAGGNGGAAPSADSTSGANGVTGTTSLFGSYVRGTGGNNGGAGTTAASAGGSSVSGTTAYSTAGGAGGFGAAGSIGGSQASGTQGATGGGGGGGVTATPAGVSGGNGGLPLAVTSVQNGGTFNTAGNAGVPYGTMPGMGGGGGGSGTSSLAAGNGGAGAYPGGGGGGGGASLNTFAAGAGGAGGGGLVLVITT